MSDINIDDLQREISAAESYLKRVPASAARGSSHDESRQGQSIMGSDVHVVAPPSAESSSISGGGVVPEKIGTDIMELNRILLRTQREEIEKAPEPPMDYLHPSGLNSSIGSTGSDRAGSDMMRQGAATPSSSSSKGGQQVSPYVNKYDDPAERDKLIAKLLAEHADRSASKASIGARSPQSVSPSRRGHEESSHRTSPTRHIGRYHMFQETQKNSQGSTSPSRFSGEKLNMGKYASGSSAPSYSAAFDAEKSTTSPTATTSPAGGANYQYADSDDLLRAYQDTGEDTLFFASDIPASAGADGAVEEGGGYMSGGLSQAIEVRSAHGGDPDDVIYGSYEGEEDSALYAPPSEQQQDELEGAADSLMATAKAVHSSGESDPSSSQTSAHVSWANQKQAELSSSIPVLSRGSPSAAAASTHLSPRAGTATEKKDKESAAKSISGADTAVSGTGEGKGAGAGAGGTIPRKKAAAASATGPPSRLLHPQPKQWRYLKSKEECEEEGKRLEARGREGGGKYSFKPQLSAKVRRERRAGKGTDKPSMVHALFNNLPMPQAADEAKDSVEGDHDVADDKKSRPKFELDRFEESVRQHQRNVDARARLKQHVENVEVSSFSFRPKISRKAQELAEQAKLQQLQLLQEERIASRYFGAGTLPQRLDPYTVGGDVGALNVGLGNDSAEGGGGEGVTVEPNNPFSHLEEDSEGNLVYNEALDDMYASHLGEQVSERLHREAQTRAEQQRWLEQKVREARAAEYPFQPEITAEARDRYAKLKKDYGVAHVPIHERVGELQKFKQKRLQDLRAAREEEEGRTNTYNPSIDKKSREIADRRRKEEEMKRRVALEDAIARKEGGEEEVAGDAAALGTNSSHRMNKFSSAIAHALVDSNNENNGPANDALDSTTAAAMSGFFHDSKRDAETRETDFKNAVNEDVESRLMKEGRATEMKMMYLQVMRERELAEQSKQAKASKGTEKLAAQSSFVGASFAERQRMYRDKVQQRQAQRQMRVEQTTSQWFNPKIGKSALVVAAAKPERLVETKDERVERLSVRDAEAREKDRLKMAEYVYKDVTFKPNLSSKTKELGRASSLDDLVEDPKGKAVREAVRRRVQEEQQREQTFRPTIPSYRPEHGSYADMDQSADQGRYSYVGAAAGIAATARRANTGTGGGEVDAHDPYRELYGSDLPRPTQDDDGAGDAEVPIMRASYSGASYGVNESHAAVRVPASVALKQQINMREPEKMVQNIKHDLQRKEEHRRGELIRSELRELQECTFTPQITSYAGSAPEGTSNVIRGLDRHMELKELTQRKKQEARDREEQVFGVKNVDSMRRVEDGTTVAAPFSLSESDSRPSRAVVEMSEREKEELTFQPLTENIKRRNDLRRAVRANKATQ